MFRESGSGIAAPPIPRKYADPIYSYLNGIGSGEEMKKAIRRYYASEGGSEIHSRRAKEAIDATLAAKERGYKEFDIRSGWLHYAIPEQIDEFVITKHKANKSAIEIHRFPNGTLTYGICHFHGGYSAWSNGEMFTSKEELIKAGLKALYNCIMHDYSSGQGYSEDTWRAQQKAYIQFCKLYGLDTLISSVKTVEPETPVNSKTGQLTLF